MNIIFDLDGTLALVDHRRHYVNKPNPDWDAFYRMCVNDPPNVPIVKLYNELQSNPKNHIEIWSGRSKIVLPQTEAWLIKHNLHYNKLLMREIGDNTPDDQLKESWLDSLTSIKRFNLMVFDDRDKVVAMWRRWGITCCQVAEGNF